MIDIKINDNTYKLPSCWEDITLKDYKAIYDFEKNHTFKSDVLYSVHLMAMLMGCDSDELMKFTSEQFEKLVDQIEWVKEDPKNTNIKEVVLNDITYVVTNDLNTITMGEKVSIDTILQNDPSDLCGLMCVLLRPRVKIYNAEKGEEEYEQEEFNIKNYSYRRELFFENLKLVDVKGITDFFLSGEKQYSENMKDSLESNNPKKNPKKNPVEEEED